MIVIWIAAIVVFGIVEAVTVGLVSIWFVLGAVAGLLAAVLGAALWVQIVLFFVVSIAALAATPDDDHEHQNHQNGDPYDTGDRQIVGRHLFFLLFVL